jgi:hypothetical protein
MNPKPLVISKPPVIPNEEGSGFVLAAETQIPRFSRNDNARRLSWCNGQA